MKKTWLLVAGLTVGMAAFALTGCGKSDKPEAGAPALEKKVDTAKPAAEQPALETKVDAAKPAESPAAQKPKDHPAH